MSDERIYKIPSDNIGVLADKFKRLGRRAVRLGLPPPTFTELKTERVEKKNPHTDLVERVYLLHHITVDAGISEVKVAGWKFCAVISHSPEGNILRKIGDVDVPTSYRTNDNFCDHCKTRRDRKDTYLLSKDGEFIQVGRSCLLDYLGQDALLYAERAQYLADLSDSMDADEFGFGGGRGVQYDALEVYLSHVAQVIKLEGWMSRGRAKLLEGVPATADIALWHMKPEMRPRSFKPLYSSPDKESVALADSSILWASEIEGEDIPDYLHNIRVIAKRGVVEDRDRGMGASIVSAYQRHLNSLRMKELMAKRAETATHVGTVGEKIRLKLYVENVITCEGAYGTSYLHAFADTEGNVFKWFSSSTTLETGKEYLIEGTVKKHDDYKNVKQNLLTRCKVIEMKNYICLVDGKVLAVEGASEAEAKKALRTLLGCGKLPRQVKIFEDTPEVEGQS